MRISEASKRAGVTPRALRHYEDVGLISPDRDGSGYRAYRDSTIRRIRFISRAQSAGFSLADIQTIFSLKDSRIEPCDFVTGRLVERLKLIEAEIERLSNSRSLVQLALAVAESQEQRIAETEICRIIESLPDPARNAA